MITTRSRRKFLKYAAGAFAAGVSPISIVQMSSDAWGQTSLNHPDTFKTGGDNPSSRMNLMFASTSNGARCFWPGSYGTFPPTPGQSYYVKIEGTKQIVGDQSIRNPTFIGDSGGQADFLLFEPTPPVYADVGSDWHALAFGIHGTWSPTDPNYQLCRDVIRINMPAGHGVGKFSGRKIFCAAGLGSSIHIIGAAENASMFGSYFSDIYTLGGIKTENLADSCVFEKVRLEGKFGFDLHCMIGTGMFAISDVQGAVQGGQDILVRAANKLTLARWNMEHKDWIGGPAAPNRRMIDISCPDLTGTQRLNNLKIEEMTLVNQSGVTLDEFVYIDKTYLAEIGAINGYAVNQTNAGLRLGANNQFPRLLHPGTYDGISAANHVVIPVGTMPANYAVGVQYWAGKADNSVNTSNPRITIIKHPNGALTYAGFFVTRDAGGQPSAPTNGEVMFGIPNGFRCKNQVAIPVKTNIVGGDCWLRAAAQTNESDGHPCYIDGIPAGKTPYEFEFAFTTAPEWHHANGYATNN